jgi:hypothetical protein
MKSQRAAPIKFRVNINTNIFAKRGKERSLGEQKVMRREMEDKDKEEEEKEEEEEEEEEEEAGGRQTRSFCPHYSSERLYNQHYPIRVSLFLFGPIKLKKLYEVANRKHFYWMRTKHKHVITQTRV